MQCIRHPKNSNLTLHYDNHYQGLPLYAKNKPYIREQLDAIYGVMNKAIDDHPRTIAIRVELRFPQGIVAPESNTVISRFIAAFKAKIKADIHRRRKQGKRVPDTRVRSIWVRECSRSLNHHYHMVIFLNMDTYYSVGDLNAHAGNTMGRIRQAWASALRIPIAQAAGLAFIPKSGIYRLDIKYQQQFESEWTALFKRLSYFAKKRTKVYGNHVHSFGCSHH